MIRVSNVALNLDDDTAKLPKLVAKKLGIPEEFILEWTIVRQSVDARKKDRVVFVYTVDVALGAKEAQVLKKQQRNPHVVVPKECTTLQLIPGDKPMRNRPIVVGTGPSGLFAALTLAQWGYRPLVLERGQDVAQRTQDVNAFWATGELKPDSNVQYGEGGAGTFSDGKLTTRVNDQRIRLILEEMVAAGAPEEILYLHKPHVGTDKLRTVVSNLRHKIVELGGEVRFGAKVTSILTEQDRIVGVVVNEQEEITSSAVILAIGNSARDTYKQLLKQDILIQPKPFAIGVRIEHPQAMIDVAQYGQFAGHPKLGAADYQLVYKNEEQERAAYSFCMCPGGSVIASSSEANGVVTNGMSEHARDTGVANSALVVSVGPEDFLDDSPLGGMYLQQQCEHIAFRLGGSNYMAPAQRVGDFLKERPSTDLGELATYQPGLVPADVSQCLPDPVVDMLREAIPDMDRRLKGFAYEEAVLTGVETRTSAPVRITRGDDLQAVGWEGLFPAGEGAGYAGGIMSAAIDGIRVAEGLITIYGKGDR